MNSRDVFDIRNKAKDLKGQCKINKLLEGAEIAALIIRNDDDEWTKKALAWVLIDLTKEYIFLGNISNAEQSYNQLLKIDFYKSDDIISSQIQFLKPKIDIQYNEIKKAEDLSKKSKHSEAFNLMNRLLLAGKLKPIHHESYGWIIYRYIKSEINTLDSVSVRRYLRDYMNLKNERPSMLHSMILNFGLNYSKEHSDFNLFNFFNLWGSNNLRHEDKIKSEYEGKNIPSLLSRICKELVDKDYLFDVAEFVDKVKLERSRLDLSSYETIDLLREPFFWKLYNYKKNNQWDELWKSFDFYVENYSILPSSEWHSKILSFAERSMTDVNAWRFFNFFRQWNPKLLTSNDWKDVEKDGNTYKSIAIKGLKKAFDYLKSNRETNIDWLIQVYEKGINKCPDNEWLKRELAILYHKSGNTYKSVTIYKKLALELYDKPYYWKEFSSLVKDNEDLHLSMLCKAALIEKNDDFIGDLRIELALVFEKKNLINEAGIELNLYKKNRQKNHWKIGTNFDKLASRINLNEGNNTNKYKEHIDLAEEFAFNDLPWVPLVYIDNFKDKKGRTRWVFSDGKEIEISPLKKFFNLKNLNLGEVLNFKLKETTKEIKDSKSYWLPSKNIKEYNPLIYRITEIEKWSTFENEYAIVDYINQDKNVIHAITFSNQEIFFKSNPKDFKKNDLIYGKRIQKKDGDAFRTELVNIQKEPNNKIIFEIEPKIAVVDGVNHSKSLFHFVVNSKIDGIVRFNETELRPNEGDFIEVRLLSKKDKKKGIVRFKVITINKTGKTNDSLLKATTGEIELKYKSNYGTREYYELDEEEKNSLSADFAFMDDFYIPQFLLEKHNIKSNCFGKIKAINDGSKWKVIDLEILDH